MPFFQFKKKCRSRLCVVKTKNLYWAIVCILHLIYVEGSESLWVQTRKFRSKCIAEMRFQLGTS